MSDYLTPEVLREIFTRLPFKSILQMRLVCKEFYWLISDPAFITAHIKKSRNNQKILLRYFCDKGRQKKHKYLMLNDDNKKLEIRNSEEIRLPFEVSLNPRYWIVGSLDGLVCLCKDYLAPDQIVLWNPSIRKCMYLPLIKKENMYHSNFYCVLGFGFDPKTNDYKVLRLTYLKDNDGAPPMIELYTLSSQSWRTLIKHGNLFVIHEDLWTQTYLNGALHWLGYETNANKLENLIISFDMSDESFGKISLPDVLVTENSRRLSLSVFKNMLSLTYSEKTNSGQVQYFIWFMDEYGKGSSWTKHYTIDLQGKMYDIIDFRKNGEVIIATDEGRLITYDTETRKTGNIKGICGASKSFFAVSYIDSLVLLGQEGVESVS